MIDRIVHHAEVITLKGPSHRLRNTGCGSPEIVEGFFMLLLG